MKNHHTKSKGDLGVLKAQADLCAKGFLVCLATIGACTF